METEKELGAAKELIQAQLLDVGKHHFPSVHGGDVSEWHLETLSNTGSSRGTALPSALC